jgi:DNA-directed RNA polymerase specialized sigma24 family protein
MPFSAHDLRYHLEQSFPVLHAYLYQRAQRYLGPLKYDAFEVDQVVGHVIEYLTRFGLMGGGDSTPETALDRLTNAQFYAFLNRSIQNKAIDRLRKKRPPMYTLPDRETSGAVEDELDPLKEASESFWGHAPFATPEEAALEAASRDELRSLLKHCIKALSTAPRQFQAMIQELEELGADELIDDMREEFPEVFPAADLSLAHLSQHKDHAHKKLRHCLQQSSTNLAVMMALRITEYGVRFTGSDELSVPISTLAQDDLSEDDVRKGLKQLVAEGLLNWQDEQDVHCSSTQEKRLARFYEGE